MMVRPSETGAAVGNRLLKLLVRDAMQASVVTLRMDQSLRAAATELANYELSGAPVMNAGGECVGVLSARDYLRVFKGHCLSNWLADGGEQQTVGQHMQTPVRSVSPATSLLEAARVMCDLHIHRLFVLDAAHRPVGVLTTLDIVAALVNAADEASTKRVG